MDVGFPQPAWSQESRPRRRIHRLWPPKDREKLKELWDAGTPIDELCETFECEKPQIYYKAGQLGLQRRTKRGRRATAGPRKHGGTQRRFAGVESSAGPKIILTDHHPAVRKGTTFFPSTVIPAADEVRMLKSGHNSRKIGAKLEKGRWKGQPIFTLTLEERDTCPRSCKEFTTCYGNNMPFARRILDDGTLTKRLWAELAVLSIENKAGFIVRLHVLGDFYSVEYVDFWRQALNDFPNLNVFGFTARLAPDPIGIALAELTRDFYDRFRMRFSGAGHPEDCSEVVETAADAKFTRCPAETSAERCCATCGLCMQSNVSISFVRH